MAKLPGIDNVFAGVMGVLQAQTEALAALPQTVTSLTQAVRGLADADVRRWGSAGLLTSRNFGAACEYLPGKGRVATRRR